ncbi:serine/threonine-protein kinase [Fodinicola feengrottensis]
MQRGAVTLLTPGTRITDTLVVDRPLGEGAFAEVHRVKHEYLGWQAMKVFKRVGSLGQTRAMLDEARLLSVLGHRNIVRLFDAGAVPTADGVRGYFTMEYVAGGSLQRLADAHHAAVPVEIAVEAVEQVSQGLAVAHAQAPPIIHRDLTLENVLVGYDATGMRVRISDFGLAQRADPIGRRSVVPGTEAFTYAFMPPEVVLRQENYSCAGDVWSIGTIAYLLLTNSQPYEPRYAETWFSASRFDDPPLAPSRFNDDVDSELDRIVLSCLETDPSDRPSDAAGLAAAFRRRRESRRRASAVSSRVTTTPTDQAQRLAAQALGLARHPSTLSEAADLMEEAVIRSPHLREQHLPQLLLWRRGVMM